jgi:nudix-type nucleoside diphosphatase (YffH/AdpP family)
MPTIFLPGPLGAPAMLAAFGASPAAPRPAWLEAHGLRFDPETLRFALIRSAGERVAGVLVAAKGPAARRIGFLLGVMGGRELVTAFGRRSARVFCAEAEGAPGRIWGEAAWSAVTAKVLVEMVPEIVGQIGRASPQEVAVMLGPAAHRARARVRGAATRAPAGLRSGLCMADVESVSRSFGYARFLAVEDHVLRHRRFDGAMSAPVTRSVLTSGDAVTVLPFDPVRGQVLLIEQFRTGPFARRDPCPWALEAVAGRCDGMEPPVETARREAREEAGLELGRLERIAGFYPTPGIAAEFITAFVGEADLGAGGGVHGLAAEDEDIRTMAVPLTRAFAALASGEVNNAPLLVSLLWLERHHERLATEWGRGGA